MEVITTIRPFVVDCVLVNCELPTRPNFQVPTLTNLLKPPTSSAAKTAPISVFGVSSLAEYFN